MSTILQCQDQYFAGGQGFDCPFPYPPSPASLEEVSKETMLSLWASGLRDNRASRRQLQTQDSFYGLDVGAPGGHDDWGEQMSSQIYANKQLQDTLVQKEEELARLHEENNKLKEYLNSAYVKSLEEKAKKLLSLSGKKTSDVCRLPKRKAKESEFTPCEASLKKARRNLFTDFTARQEQTPPVNTWVLQTLGLKDVNTIDDTSPVEFSALSTIESYGGSPVEAMDYSDSQDSLIGFQCAHTTPVHHNIDTLSGEASPYLHHCASADAEDTPPTNCATFMPSDSPPCYASDVSPNKTEIAFSTSLNPHRNVKTHTFAQGQAFVRRDDEGGWKFTWVPKQSE